MYFIDKAQIDKIVVFIDQIRSNVAELQGRWADDDPLLALAEERIIHLAIEAVTDIGSLIIDGIMLREASSYEDIIEVLKGEDVFSQSVADVLIELVQLRKSLVQQYTDWDRSEMHHIVAKLSPALE